MSHVYGFDELDSVPPGRATELLGGKAALLAEMATRLDLPVPPGFAITTGFVGMRYG